MSDTPNRTAVAPEVAAEPVTLREKLAAGRFVISAEVDPPHGLRTRKVLQGAAILKDAGIDAINVGDSPTAKVRMSPLAMSVLLQRELGVEIVMHYTTRDRNALAIHSDMVGAHVLGIRNILCLRGDPPSVGGYTDIVGVWDISAVGLMRSLKLLNDGVDWTGKPISGEADFFIGASCDPNADPLEPQLRLMRRKAEAGAQFFVTQNVFDEYPHITGDFIQKLSEWITLNIDDRIALEEKEALLEDRIAATDPANLSVPTITLPNDGDTIYYETMNGAIAAAWTGNPHAAYIIEYDIGEGWHRLKGKYPVESGTEQIFGPLPKDGWKPLYQWNPYKLRVRPRDLPNGWSEWITINVAPLDATNDD